LSKEEFTSHEPCPDSWTLVAYEAGKVDEETARHLRAHLLFCDACAKEFYALRRSSREESWQQLIEQLNEFLIDLGKTYGVGTLVGPVRIVAEQPVLARGGKLPESTLKVLEVLVGENTYSIEMAVTEEGSVSCDIAGMRTPSKTPLSITARSGIGEELKSTQTDEFGNARLQLLATSLPDDLIVFTFDLEGSEQQLLLRVPQRQSLA
jgi:hypothetical protein